jgi:hypothetical protein
VDLREAPAGVAAGDQAGRLRVVGAYVYTATEDYFRTSDMHDRCRYVAGAAALPEAARPGLTVAE